MEQPIIFGVRHLSPAGAWHLIKLLNKVRPKLVLIEGPSDLNDQMEFIADKMTIPPLAILAYTKELPVRTILYPFAEYSPEYQAILWSFSNGAQCRFIDLPSSTFLAFHEPKAEDNAGNASDYVYEKCNETFWERTMEHCNKTEDYFSGAREFGAQLREFTQDKGQDYAENILREAFMKRQIEDAVENGIAPSDIVVVTGSFHVTGLLDQTPSITDEEIRKMPHVESDVTLMPYSYYRLSSRSGYGAGNKAPAYYSLLWEGFIKGSPMHTTYSYLSRIAAFQRKYGNMVSSAEVIEAVRLASSLAELRGSSIPVLRDMQDAAVTCMGHGKFSEIAMAAADTEIGTMIGSLPEGISRTSIQEDFYRVIHYLNLNKYKSVIAQDLHLNLREKLNAKSEKAAFADLERSFFLHRLRIMDIHFAAEQVVNQQNATWAEHWVLRWTPEAEIEIVEAALKGDTIELGASFILKERVDSSTSISEITKAIQDSFLCGLPGSVTYAAGAFSKLSTDAAAITEIGQTIQGLTMVISYGNIRKIDPLPLLPLVTQLFLRGCLLLPGACVCDNNGAEVVVEAAGMLNDATIALDFLDNELWFSTLKEISNRDDLNTKVSGYATAILLERGKINNEQLGVEMQRRLSKGIPADLGAGWFEGLSLKNRYALIARLTLWEHLNLYLDSLDDEEFKRSLVFLRRAFSDFSSKEKNDIAENLGEIWEVNPSQVSEVLNNEMNTSEQEILESLDEFNFDEI